MRGYLPIRRKASRRNRPAEYASGRIADVDQVMRHGRARSRGDGLAVPMSMPRYTCAESTLTISTGKARGQLRAPAPSCRCRSVPSAGPHQWPAAADGGHRPRRNRRSRSSMPTNDQVGRPCTHWSARSVVSISRSSAFISGYRQPAIRAHGLVTGHGAERALERLPRAAAALLAQVGEHVRSERGRVGRCEQRRHRSHHELRRAAARSARCRGPRTARACASASSASATDTLTATGTSSGCAAMRRACIAAFSRS